MKLPRDISGNDLAKILKSKYGYRNVRQSGSHLRLSSDIRESNHRITIPLSDPIPVGTLSRILKDVAAYLKIEYKQLVQESLGKE